MQYVFPQWRPSAALLLALPMAAVTGGVFVWVQSVLPTLALLIGLGGLLGALGGPCTAPAVGLVLGFSVPASVFAAASLRVGLPYDALWLSDGVSLLLTMGAACSGAILRWAAFQWDMAKRLP